MKEILKTLVELPTVTTNKAVNAQALDFIDNYLRERGMHISRFSWNGYGTLVATIRPETQPTVLLAAHVDVVPAPDEEFTLREQDGKLIGRGTLDMKFAIAAYLQLVNELRLDLDKYDFGIMITSDEEAGGANGVARFVEEGYLPKICILPDGGDNWQIQTFAKAFLEVKVSVKGRAAHGSKPWTGHNAILELIQIIQEIQTLFPEHQTAETNTLNVGLLNGGQTGNQVAAEASTVLDARFMSNPEKDAILAQITTICQRHGAELLVTINGSACNIDLNDPLVAPFVEIVQDVTGIQVHGSRTTGTNDLRFFAAKGIPGISLYPTGGAHHGSEEWISEAAFYQFKDVLRAYLDQVARHHTTDQQAKPRSVDASTIVAV